jgi:hypothetical protein
LIRIEYSGYDQEGKICAFRGMNAEYCERRVPLEVIRSVALREFIGALLEARYPDWMSGEGSCGDFAWNLTTDTLVHVHRYRCMSAEIARHEGVTP